MAVRVADIETIKAILEDDEENEHITEIVMKDGRTYLSRNEAQELVIEINEN